MDSDGGLRDRRLKKNISLRTAAREVGISAQYLSEIERGRKIHHGEVIARAGNKAIDIAVIIGKTGASRGSWIGRWRMENMRAIGEPRAYPARTLRGRFTGGFLFWRR